MSYEAYKGHRLAPDDNGCWDVLDSDYQALGTYPSKAAAKRAIDLTVETMPDQAPQTLEEVIQKNIGVDLRGYTDGEEATMWLKSLKTDLTALMAKEGEQARQEVLDELEKLTKREWGTVIDEHGNRAVGKDHLIHFINAKRKKGDTDDKKEK